MMVTARGSVLGVLQWQSAHVVRYAASGGLAAGVHGILGWDFMVLPVVPLSIVGAALGIFLSFRANSAYERWWEGRRLWGGLVNTSRMLTSQVLGYVADDARPRAERVVHRHLAFVHALRCQLRDQDPLADAEVVARLDPADVDGVRGRSNVAYALLHRQQLDLAGLHRAGAFDGWAMQSLDRSVAALLDVQGGCERIKRTPLPRGYAFLIDTLLSAFALLLPWALVADLSWLVIPMNILVCGSFLLISETGRVLEDPFSLFWNGLPLSALSRTIEINVREALGDRDLPPAHQPDAHGILM